MISVLIPAYNAERTIGDAIRSVLGQAVECPLELLICDDGSSDGMASVVESLAREDDRIRLVVSPSNGGVSQARNRLLDQAQGEWIAFLDADDIFLPGKLAACLRWAAAQASDYVSHDLAYLRSDGTVVGRIANVDFVQAAMFSRNLMDGLRFSETLVAGEDTQFFGRLRQRAHKHWHFPEVLTALKISPGSLTDRFWFEKRVVELWHSSHDPANVPNSLDEYLGFFRSLPKPQQFNYMRKWWGQKFGRSAAGAMFDGNRVIAASYLSASLLLDPGYAVSRWRTNLRRRI